MSEFFKSKNLSHFVGNSDVVKELKGLISSDRSVLGASILVHGPNGVGKSTLCYQLARIILSDFSENLIPEHKILNTSHTDFHVVDSDEDSKNRIKVEDIRKALSFASYTSAESKYRVIIIDKVDDMTLAASNALLKVLEEPPANTFIFLIADCIGKVLPTLRSRCLKFYLRSLNLDEFSQIVISDNGLDSMQDDVCESFYRASFGSVTFAYALKLGNLIDVLSTVEEIILDGQKTFEKIGYVVDAALASSFGWKVVRGAIFKVFVYKLKQELNSDVLKRRVDYLFEIEAKFNDVEIFNLDKKSAIYSILC